MQRSGAQKLLLVLSVLIILVALIVILGGLLASVSAAAAGPLAMIGGVALLIYGGLELAMGVLGIRASRDNTKVVPVWILSLISLLLGVIGFVLGAVGGSLGDVNNILSRVLGVGFTGLIFWAANTIRREAGV